MPLVDLISKELEDEDLERALLHKERWDAYEGKHPDSLPVVTGTAGRPDVNDNVKYNVSGLTVDKGVSFLFGGIDQDITFGIQEDEETPDERDDASTDEDEVPISRGPSPDEQWLEACWAANRKKTLLQNIGTNGGVVGHFFVRLFEDGARLDQRFPRIVNLDPSYVTPIFQEDDYEIVVGYKIQYTFRTGSGRVKVRRTLIEPNNEDMDPTNADSWVITVQESIGQGDFIEVREPEFWDYPFPPILDAQNLPKPNEYWGKSDIERDVVDLNFALNRSLSSMQRILRLHGHPKPYAKGVTPDQIAILIQGVDRIWTLPADADIGQLEMTGDLQAAIEFFRQMKSGFHEVAKNPQVDPDKLGSVGGLSGVALRILYQPLLEQTGTKHGTYGDFLRELNRRLMVLGRLEPKPVTIAWPDPIPLDIKETAEGLSIARDLGLSQETALGILGFDPELEEERRANDTAPVGAGLGGILDSAPFNGGTAV